jgi:prenylcysteine oxidase/farnesylcysteine lyase
MAKAATSDIRLNTTVKSISIHEDKTFSIKYSSEESSSDSVLQFDEVILAAPYQYSDLKISPEPEALPETIPYVKLHVTLFASPHRLAPSAFYLPEDAQVPLVVLTTLHPSESPGTKPSYAGKAGFFSISMLRPVKNPDTQAQEYLYKIFSPEAVSPSFLAKMLGLATPETMETFSKDDVSWLYRKIWHSYPVEYPRLTFEKLSLAPGLWYTGGIESFISTMETSALMGRNVARLIVDKWEAEKNSEGAASSSSSEDSPDPYSIVVGDQKVLKAKL